MVGNVWYASVFTNINLIQKRKSFISVWPVTFLNVPVNKSDKQQKFKVQQDMKLVNWYMIKSSGNPSAVLDRIWSQGQPHSYLCEFFNNLLFISYWNYWNKIKWIINAMSLIKVCPLFCKMFLKIVRIMKERVLHSIM